MLLDAEQPNAEQSKLLDEMAERYRVLVRSHADTTAGLVLAALASLALPLFVPFAVARIVVANRRAMVMAHRYLTTARYVTHQEAIPLPVTLPDEGPRITKAVTTAADRFTQGHGRGSVERLARSEPLRAGQRALSQAVAVTGQGWLRHAGRNACRVCTGLADGIVLPADVAMVVPHPSCSCTQRPAMSVTDREAAS